MVFIRVNKKYDNYQEVLIIPVGGFPFLFPAFDGTEKRAAQFKTDRTKLTLRRGS